MRYLLVFSLAFSMTSQAQQTVNILPVADNAVRVVYGNKDAMPEMIYLGEKKNVDVVVKQSSEGTVYSLPSMTVVVEKNEKIKFLDKSGKVVLREESHAIQPSSVQGEPTFVSTATFDSPANEHLYGLGQFQDGYLNVRGLIRRLTQVNTQIAMPVVTSSRGYTLVWNNYGMTEYNPCANSIEMQRKGEGEVSVVEVTSTEGNKREHRQEGLFHTTIDITEEGDYTILLDVGRTMARRHNLVIDGKTVIDVQNVWLPPTTSIICHLTKGTHMLESELTRDDKPVIYYNKVTDQTVFRSPVSEALDYTVFVGSADESIVSYREITGNSPMLPLWAFGYVHCRERFHSSEEILTTANIFRQKQLPMDVMVQDWQWWGKYGWNSMRFDEAYYPDPKLLVDSLHSMGSRLMLSVWSKIDESSEVGKEAQNKGYYIPGTSWIDFFNKDAAQFYWQNFSDKLLKPYGIDCWWQDATEPENDDLLNRRINNGRELGERYRNIYPNLVSQTVYEGSRKDAPDHRTLILTRSGFPGIQRYGSFLWSGDVGNDWQTLRYQLTAGLGLMAAGHPWWTYDAGGFFRPYGQYDDKAFHERFIRWLQLATFLPMMRVHGYMTDTEFWKYGEEVERLAKQQLTLRYSLIPYIYSNSYAVTKGSTMMRPLVMDFADDDKALDVTDQYMFGKSLLVAPVLEPSASKRNVYLPETEGGWYDFHTGKRLCTMGMNIAETVALDKIPVYVKAGSIIPIAQPIQTTANYLPDSLVITVYPGADATFTLYEDEGTNYNYEKGEYTVIPMTWNEKSGTLTIGKRSGAYSGMLKNRTFLVRIVGEEPLNIKYNGKKKSVKLMKIR